MKKSFETTIVHDGSMCFVPLPFDPKAVFGKTRAPVKVTLNGYTYRSTIASMGNGPCVPLRRSSREAAGLEGNEKLRVTLELDTEKREIKPRADFVTALKAATAKKPETRARRIEGAVRMIARRPPKTPSRPRGGE